MRTIMITTVAVTFGICGEPSTALAQQPVSWSNLVNATANGSTLQKTGGCDGCTDAGGVSQQQIQSGGASVSFTPSVGAAAGLALYAGFAHATSTPPLPSEIDFAFSFWANGGWEVRERGVYKTDSTFTAGDTFAINIDSGGAVTYSRNGTTVYTSTSTAGAYPYSFAASLLGTSAAVASASVTTATQTNQPTTYDAISDRVVRTKPALPALGAAGYTFTDPSFSSRMLRVTDASTRPGSTNRSYRAPSNAHLAAWNSASTYFYIVSDDGTVIPYAFDAAQMRATRLQPSSSGNGGLTLAFYVEPQFSVTSPNIIYGIASGGNNRTIKQYDFTTNTYTTILDLDSVVSGLSGFVGGIMSGATSPETLLVFFGGAQQDAHYYALWYSLNGTRKLLNTVASTLNGATTSVTLNFHLHATQLDKSGRFVFLYPTSADLGSPRFASPVYLWDTNTDAITPLTTGGADGSPNLVVGGHDAAGYGYWVNKDCCTASTWDAAQWQFRPLTSVASHKDLIAPVLSPQEVYLADHSSWNNAQPGVLEPVISSTYRYGDNTTAWRAWDDELIAIQTDVAAGSGATVWRFGHHRSDVVDEHTPPNTYFWYQPTVNVSPDGQWALFTSNWEKTLGTNPNEGRYRQDVFVMELRAATP